MMTFEEWCSDREVNINELSPKFLTMAYKIWGEECYYETKKLEAESAELSKRLETALNPPCKRKCYIKDIQGYIHECWQVLYIDEDGFLQVKMEADEDWADEFIEELKMGDKKDD